MKNEFIALTRKVAAEGAVLLWNENQVLPIMEQERVSIFGRNQIDFYRSGTGSGGAVKVAYSTNLIQGLRDSGRVQINEELAEIYEDWIKEHPFDNGGGGWAAEPWFQTDMPLNEKMVKQAARFSQKALYCIGRTAGEDKDNLLEEGSFLLTQTEKENLVLVSEHFNDVIVVLNTNNIIDMDFLDKLKDTGKIQAAIYVWAGGMEGGNAAADVLTGKVSPSGKLTDTIADYENYPSAKNHGGEDENVYEEDIYVGYRYFETFCPDKVRYEFGYGLSYTEFEVTPMSWKEENGTIVCPVVVKNAGTYAGKEVVQIYFEAPQGKLGKPVKQLIAFQKTKTLQPGEVQELRLCFQVADMASYDDTGVTNYRFSYCLEAGDYHFYMGTSVKKVVELLDETGKNFRIENTYATLELTQALPPEKEFYRMKPGKKNADGTYQEERELVKKIQFDLEKRIQEKLPEALPMVPKQGYVLKDVKEGKITMNQFISQLTLEDLACIVRGEGMGHPDVTPGTASAFGGVSDSLKDLGIPLACAADGPSGVRMENGKTAVQLPIGTLLAATWNPKLVQQLYTYEGQEVAENQVDTLLGPGLNIHRNPLNGRNFEYFSEDPLLTGCMASAAAGGIYHGGAFATLKHFACNSQEKRRSFVNACVSERALREIYLKGFEMAVKSGTVFSIMTSYNPINGHYAASNYDLTTTILRDEWNYQGIVMTDWWAKMNDVVVTGEGDIKKTRDMIRAQNDLYMVVNNYGAEINNNQDDTIDAVKAGRLTVGELQRCAKNICRFLMQTQALSRVDEEKEEIPVLEGVKKQLQADKVQRFEPGKNDTIKVSMGETSFVQIEEDCVVSMIAKIMSPDSNMVQNTAQIVWDDTVNINLQTQGTAGVWINQKLSRIELKKGIHSIYPEVLKPHMEIESIQLLKK